MNKLKSVNIKGKEYVEVNERLRYFRSTYPNYSLTSEVLEKTDKSILVLATIINEDGRVIATGMAEEEKGSTFINKTSYVENCETSAWGRALANFGIGLDTSVASAEEVQNAIANQEPKEVLMDLNDEKMVDVLKYVVANKSKGLEWIVKNIGMKYKVTTKVKNTIKKTLQDGEKGN
jgi:deoxycytidylate deaminase|tara:strand:- start:16432 stop:16962 length:531 start_codon:yes stop_codon:yes gene_type:complete